MFPHLWGEVTAPTHSFPSRLYYSTPLMMKDVSRFGDGSKNVILNFKKSPLYCTCRIVRDISNFLLEEVVKQVESGIIWNSSNID